MDLAGIMELLTHACEEFETKHADRLCGSMARIVRKMHQELMVAGFSDEDAMSIITAGVSRLQQRGNNQ